MEQITDPGASYNKGVVKISQGENQDTLDDANAPRRTDHSSNSVRQRCRSSTIIFP